MKKMARSKTLKAHARESQKKYVINKDQLIDDLLYALEKLTDDIRQRRREKDKGSRNSSGHIVHQKDKEALIHMDELLELSYDAIAKARGETE